MKINHRHVVRRASYLATHPWTRRAITVTSLVILLVTVGVGNHSFAANFTQTVTTKADFELGALSSLDTESTPDRLQLQAGGSWGARSWAEPPDTIESGSSFSSDGTYVYTLRGGSSALFWRYDPTLNTWRAMADAPFAVGIGSDMRYDSTGAIYAAFGLYSKKFAKYIIATNSWTELTDTPDVVGNGGGLAFDGTNMYLLRGNGSQDFYRYNVASGTWDPLTGPPATISNGADLIYNSGYLYAFRGSNTLSFYRYDISAGTWNDAVVADVTAGGNMNADGNAMVVGDYIYKARSAGTATWYRYSISGNTWAQLTDMPLTVNYGGLIYVSGTDRIYSFRGTSTRTFWSWDPNTSTWIGSAEPIVSGTAYTVGTGANLVSDGSQYLYLLRGNNTANLLRYDTSANTWSLMANSVVSSTTYNFNTDIYGVKAGSYLYFLQGGNTNFLRYDISGNSWSLMSGTGLAAISNGGGLVYPGSGDYIYALRGSGTATFYRYSILGNSWDDAAVADLPTSPQASVANIGARMTSDGTNIFALLGNGVSRFLQYTVLTNTWSEIAAAPFPAYYGTSLEYQSGKIYALAGYYKDKFYEYNVSGNSWRKLANTQLSAAGGIGAYNGASLAALGSTVYAVRGSGVVDFWTYSIDSNAYATSGTYTSPVFDFSYVSAWVSLDSTTSAGSDSALVIETRSSADSSSWTSYEDLSSGNIQSTANRYLQVRVTLTASTDKATSPTLSDFTITYTSDETAPTNPSSASGSSQQVSGTALVSGNSYPHTAPYFTWTGASDAGSGLQGYYVYFGTDSGADPATAGTLTTSAAYTANTAMSSGTYYLRIKAVDNKNNKAGSSFAAFTYVYNGVTPPQGLQMTSQANFETGTLSSVSATQSAGNLQLSTAAGTWNEESLPPPPATIFYGGRFAHVSATNKLYTFRGNNTTTFYSYDIAANTWTTEGVSPVGVHTGGGLVEGPSGYLYGWAGNNLSTFMRYSTATSTWDDSAAAELPLSANYGARAVYDGSRYIYFLRGNSDDAFWKYDTENNSWTNLSNTNFGNGVASQVTYEGSDLTYDGVDTIYATQGNNYHFFARYTISTDTWTPLPPAPVAFYFGGTLNYDTTTNALYGLAGNSRGVFLKYDINDSVWSVIQAPPLVTSYGAAQRIVGRNLYTLRGNNTTTFWIYDLDLGVWKKPVQNVFGTIYAGTVYFPVAAGASVVKGDGNYYYATRGSSDSQFIRYDRSNSSVTAMAPVPEGINTGGSLVYDSVNGEIYATTGTLNLDLFKYTISTNSWTKINSGSTDLVPATLGDGSSMVYDGSRYIYLSRGAGGAQFYRYDTQASAGSRWSTMTSSTAAAGAGSSLVYDGGYVYMIRGVSTASFYRYDVGANTWSDPAVADAPGTVTTGGSLASGGDGKIYLGRGNIGTPPQNWYSYDISGNTWSTLNNAPAGWGTGGEISGSNGEQLHGYLGQGTNAITDGIYTYTQQTATTSFAKTGTYLSAAHGLSSVYKWGNLTTNYTAPANTTVTIKTQSSSDGSSWSSLTAVTNPQRLTGTDTYTYQIASPAAAYLRLEITLTSDGLYSPTFNDYTVNYYQDTTAPSNPDTITTYNSSGHASTLTTDTWYNHTAPEFNWSGATDNAGGAGVAGYFLYLGTDSSADPTITSGIINSGSAVQFQEGTSLAISQPMSSGSTYYFRVKTRDNAQNTSGTAWAAFIYKFDNTAPTNPSSISVSPAGYSASDSFTFSYSAGSDAQSGILKYQYRTGADDSNSWTDANPVTTTSIAIPNGQHAGGQYQSGTNVFYLRTVDNAGNASSATSANYYYSGTAPTPPQNVAVSPSSSDTNSFTVTWDAPATYVGDENQLTYLWTVNVLPTSNNVTSTTAKAVGPAALATQEGTNTFYVVARDGAGNTDYSLYGQVSFTASTSAPSVPNDFTVSDLSDRDAQKYGAALSWAAPTTYDSGNFSGYKVYRSIDDATYSEISTTTGTAYVDQGLTGGGRYYYRVTAYTRTNVESVATSNLSVTPTGKFTSSPTIGAGTIGTTVFARRVKFTWITTRTRGDGSGTSFVKCGLSPQDLNVTAGDFAQVLSHDVTVEGLTPSTVYKCMLYSTDVDGNTAEYGPMDVTTAPPPVVSDAEVTNIGLTNARVNFKTNIPAKGKIKYGETSNFGSVIEFPSYGQEFSVPLESLKDTTTYYYGFEMITVDGDVFAQEVINKFETLPMPVVANVQVEPVINVDTPTLKITYTTNVPTSSTVLYGTDGARATEATASDPLSTSHEVTLQGLLALRIYSITATGRDAYGNPAVSQTVYATTKGDTKPPEVLTFVTESRPQTDGKTILVAKVETNEITTAQIEVAAGSGATNFSIIGQEDGLNQTHNLSISVQAGGVYSVRVKTADGSGNVTYTKVVDVSGGVRKPTPVQLISRTMTKNFSWIFNVWKKK